MRVTIKGLTASTITFNVTGIILRGDSRFPEQYTGSIAHGVPVNSIAQVAEIRGLKRAGLISIELVDAEGSDLVYELFPDMKPKVEPEENRGPGRPKGAKNKPKEEVVATKKTEIKKVVKRIASASGISSKKSIDGTPEEDSAVVVTPEGIKRRATIKEQDKITDLDKDDRTIASINALKNIEDEAQKDRDAEIEFVDESKFDLSDRSGQKAVIGTGKTTAKKVSMKNSIIPEADEIRKRSAFIDKNADNSSNDDSENDESEDTDHFIEC